MILQSYCDESHDEKSERIYVVAGYFADEIIWTDFTQRWAKALNESGIDAFHQSECVGKQGEFKGMSFEEREELQRKFIKIIVDTPLIGSVSGILLEPYNKILLRIKAGRTIAPGRSVSGSLEDPYFLGFQHAVELIAKSAENRGIPNDETIAFIFDRTHLKGRTAPLYDSLLNSKTLDFVGRLGTLAFGDKTQFLPLQAADILAYENFRHMDDCMLKGEPERWQWIEAMKRVPNSYLFNEQSLEKLMQHTGW